MDFADIVQKQMLPLIELSLTSGRAVINKQMRKYCFEIFGYDFMVDKD